VQVNALPSTLRAAIDSISYGRRDVELISADHGHPGSSGDGYRAGVVLVDLATGRIEGREGSWGGSNIFATGSAAAIDAHKSIPIPEGYALISYTRGGSRPVYATITVHPSNMAALLPAPSAELSREEQIGLALVIGFKSNYRADRFRDLGLGAYGGGNSTVQSLLRKGLVTVNKAGSVAPTTAGRNARTDTNGVLQFGDERVYV